MENNKHCKSCKEIKPKEDFSKGHGNCHTCRRNKAKELYREQHPKQIKEKIDKKAKFICECGGSYTYSNKATHMKTESHISKIEALNRPSTAILAPTPDEYLWKFMSKFYTCITEYKDKATMNSKDINIDLLCIQQNYSTMLSRINDMVEAYIVRNKIAEDDLKSKMEIKSEG